MGANRHIRKGTVLAFTSPKGVPAYVYVARRPPNANYGLGYVFVAAAVDLDQGLVADDAVTCCCMGFKDTVAEWPVVAQQLHKTPSGHTPRCTCRCQGSKGRRITV